jgi:hypothetical protein
MRRNLIVVTSGLNLRMPEEFKRAVMSAIFLEVIGPRMTASVV